MAADLERNRRVWEQVNASAADDEGIERWSDPDISWGLFRLPEADLALLGDVAGLDVLELGCGTAYLSGWLARAGARPVGLDLSAAQLATARRCQRDHAVAFPLVEATAEALPIAGASVDLVVSEYGAGPWCDPARWIAEAARVLRPGGRLVALTNSVLAALCVPAEGGLAGDRLLRSARDLAPVTWPGGGTEHHPSHGDWIAHLRAAGLVIDALHELHPPPGATDHERYEIVSAAWAQRWPAEDVWVAHRPA